MSTQTTLDPARTGHPDGDARPLGQPAAEAVPPSRRARLTWLPWLVVPVVVALAYALLPAPSELRAQYQASALALVTAGTLGWLLTRRSALAQHSAAALVAGVLPGLTLIALHGTGWWFSGPYGDQSFRLQYAARFAGDLGTLGDYTYADVPAFYSPGYFWLVGLVARVTGLGSWNAYKWVGIAALYAAAALTFWLWRRTCSTRLSTVLLTVTVLGLPSTAAAWLGSETLLRAGAYEPYGLLVILPMPALLTWFAVARGPFSWRRGLVLGLALGIAAWIYLLYAAVAVLGILALASWPRTAGRRARWAEVVTAGVTSVLVVLPWLGPFLLAFVAAGMPPALATTYVNDESRVHLLSPAATPWFLVAVLGGVALLGLGGERFRRLRGCQALLLTVLVFGVLQLVAGQVGRGVLFHRLLLVLGVTLLAGATLAAAGYAPTVVALLRRRLPSVQASRLLAAGISVLLFIGLVGHAGEWMEDDGPLRQRAHDIASPDGRLSPLATVEARELAAGDPPVADLAAAVEDVTRRAGRPDTGTVLTDSKPLLATTPLFAYLQWWEVYSNPLGEYPRRQAVVQDLAGQQPDEMAAWLRAQPDGPTVFVLRVDGDEVTYRSAAWDPAVPVSKPWSVRLPLSVFDSGEFVSTRVDGWLVAALRA